MDSPNRLAIEIVDEAIDFADEFGLAVHHLDGDATVLDFGLAVDGGLEAGLLLAEITTAGLATVQTRLDSIMGAPITHVELATDHPAIALLGCQHPGWALVDAGIDGFGSGPAQLLTSNDPFGLAIADEFDLTTLVVESTTRPDASVADHVATAAGVPKSGVFLLAVPRASLAGSVATAARAAGVATHRLVQLGYDPRDVISAMARAPVAPVAGDERAARARTYDALVNGARVHLVVREDTDCVTDLPFGTDEHGNRPFADILADVDGDLAAAEEALAPAVVTVDVRGGPTSVVGEVDDARLADRLGL